MNKKTKILILTSMFLNIILILVVIWSIIQMNYITERTIKTNVIDKLFELHETISKQESGNWDNLSLVSAILLDTGFSTGHASNVGATFKTLSDDESKLLMDLGSYLTSYSFSISNPDVPTEALEKMKSGLIEFNSILAEAGFDDYEEFDNWNTKNYLKKIKSIVPKF